MVRAANERAPEREREEKMRVDRKNVKAVNAWKISSLSLPPSVDFLRSFSSPSEGHKAEREKERMPFNIEPNIEQFLIIPDTPWPDRVFIPTRPVISE